MVTSHHLVYLLPVFLVANRTGDFGNWKFDTETFYDARLDDTAPGIDSRAELSDWKYGPELIYDVRIDATSPGIAVPEENFVYNTTMKLKCRQKTYLVLSCRFHKPRMTISSINWDGRHEIVNVSEPIEDQDPTESDNVFEYSVNPHGNDDSNAFSASSTMPGSLMDVARVFTEIRYAPDYLHKVGWGKIMILENSTAGIQCETKYDIGWKKLGSDAYFVKRNQSGIKLMIAPNTTIGEHKIIEINRTRNLDNCQTRLFTRFGNGQEGYRTSSKTHMKITEQNFTSWTTNEAVVRTIGSRDAVVNAREILTLNLEDIIPATGPAITIYDTQTFGASGTQVFHTYSVYTYLFPKHDSELR